MRSAIRIIILVAFIYVGMVSVTWIFTDDLPPEMKTMPLSMLAVVGSTLLLILIYPKIRDK